MLLALFASHLLLADPQEKPHANTFAPATYKICYDIDMSPYAGGEDLLMPTRMLERTTGWFFAKSPAFYSRKGWARGVRLLEEFLVWLPVNCLATVTQHEVFGHGYRLRDIHHTGRAKVDGYGLDAPPPYGDGGGYTSYKVYSQFTLTENSAVAGAGVESTGILSSLTKLKWIEAKRVDPRQAFLYLFCLYDLPIYVGTIDLVGDFEGHDIKGYIDSVDYTYPERLMRVSKLKALSWINLADPFTYYAIYSLFRYIDVGKETRIPMIGGCYLPNFRLGLTPFGPEVFFENYFRLTNGQPIYGYVKGGKHSGNGYAGVGVYGPRLKRWGEFDLGLRVDLWSQPKLLLGPGRVPFDQIDLSAPPNPDEPIYSEQEQHERSMGMAASLIGAIKKGEWLGFEAELGYKARGFLPGYSLRSFPTVRLSLGAKF
jgi:hypothetical protein